MSSYEADPWDLDAFRLAGSTAKLSQQSGRVPIPRHGDGEPFLRGPIAWDWIATACRLPGSGLHAALAVRFLCGRFRGPNRWGLTTLAKGWGVHPRSARRALHDAAKAGLIAINDAPGRKLVVSVRELPKARQHSAHRTLVGPIPWSWLRPALLLPGSAVQTACVCWLQAGWSRSGEFELSLSEWGELGLSRFSASRGLDLLASAGLAHVCRQNGQCSIIQLQSVYSRLTLQHSLEAFIED